MPPLEQTLARVAEAGDLAEAIQAEPDHFIYKGLVGALAKMREVEASGGWGTVPPGRAIKPGASDPACRRPHAAPEGGELEQAAVSDSSQRYAGPLVDAVKLFQSRHRLPETGLVDPEDGRGAQRLGLRARRAGPVNSSAPAGCWAGSRATSSS